MTTEVEAVIAPPGLDGWDITHLVCCVYANEYENGERTSLKAFCGREVAGDPAAETDGAICLPCGLQVRKRECPEFGICPYLTQRQVP